VACYWITPDLVPDRVEIMPCHVSTYDGSVLYAQQSVSDSLEHAASWPADACVNEYVHKFHSAYTSTFLHSVLYSGILLQPQTDLHSREVRAKVGVRPMAIFYKALATLRAAPLLSLLCLIKIKFYHLMISIDLNAFSTDTLISPSLNTHIHVYLEDTGIAVN
jgi:hypothetical protein